MVTGLRTTRATGRIVAERQESIDGPKSMPRIWREGREPDEAERSAVVLKLFFYGRTVHKEAGINIQQRARDLIHPIHIFVFSTIGAAVL